MQALVKMVQRICSTWAICYVQKSCNCNRVTIFVNNKTEAIKVFMF